MFIDWILIVPLLIFVLGTGCLFVYLLLKVTDLQVDVRCLSRQYARLEMRLQDLEFKMKQEKEVLFEGFTTPLTGESFKEH